MVVALIALGVALGGTSVAATTGLVTGTQLRCRSRLRQRLCSDSSGE